MQQHKTETATATVILRELSYAKSLVVSLALYAQHDEAFRHLFKEMTEQHASHNASDELYFEVPAIGVLMPRNKGTALKRANWLIKRLTQGNLPEADQALALLEHWERIRIVEDPKNVIIGSIDFWLPVLGFGHMNSVAKMTCLISDAMAKGKAVALAKRASQATSQLVADALRAANYDVSKLEPELADWLFGDRTIEFYRTTSQQLQSIAKELRQLHIPHATTEENGELSLLAITPAANNEVEQGYWNLEAVA